MTQLRRFDGFYLHVGVALVAAAIGLLVMRRLPTWGVHLVLTPLLLAGYHYRAALQAMGRALLLVGVMLAIILNFGYDLASVMQRNIAQPREWDFHLFWLYGQVAAAGQNPYEQENLLRLDAPLNSSEEFVRELYFFQSPPSLFLYHPLGWFEMSPAYAVWYAINGAALLACLYLMWRIFLPDDGWYGLVLVTALTMSYFPVRYSMSYGQVNFIILLCLLLFWRDRDRQRGGIWLALGTLVKPIVVLMPLYWLLRRRWKLLAGFVATLVAASLLTILFYGPTMFFSYITHNPIINDLPPTLYTETMNQSLLATVLRLTNFDIGAGSPYFQPLFLLLTAGIVLASCWIAYSVEERHSDYALVLILLMAMLIFPKTLQHYLVYLLLPMLWLWQRRTMFPNAVWGVTALLAVQFAGIRYQPELAFWLDALMWAVFIGIGVALLRRKAAAPQPAPV